MKTAGSKGKMLRGRRSEGEGLKGGRSSGEESEERRGRKQKRKS